MIANPQITPLALEPSPIGAASLGMANLPQQRWQLHPAQPELAAQLADQTGLTPLLAQVLLNRGITTGEQAQGFFNPETLKLTPPNREFADLDTSVTLLVEAIQTQAKIAICGDYDADGMTSTALLLRALRALGADIDYAIPSRMQEGYGLNERIVEEFHAEGVAIILTVDNGIAAHAPIALARELGLAVIVTDHHDLPPELPNASAILNPKLLAPDSIYASLAGVGVAYILAVSLAQRLGKTQALVTPLLELCTLGTIADLAPLTGVNRRWLRRGLALLPQSKYTGVQALIAVSGSQTAAKASLKPEAIGFRLGPRINAIGRIGNPQTVIELLTTDDSEQAQTLAQTCEQANQTRQQLCSQIELEAIDWVESQEIDLEAERVLVVVQPGWHHGVIGIVASRLVERYGVPVFIGTTEDEAGHEIRGSARGIPEFDVFAALQTCSDLLGRFGGHRAAGGFSFPAKNLAAIQAKLSQFACQCLEPGHLRPLVTVDATATFDAFDWEFYQELQQLQPCGMGNPLPVFCSQEVLVLDQRVIGADGNHLKLVVGQLLPGHKLPVQFKATAWRWGAFFPLPAKLDIAYQIVENNWNGETTLELNIVGARLPQAPQANVVPAVPKARPVTLVEPAAPDTSEPESPPEPLLTVSWLCPDPPVNSPDQVRPNWLPLEDLHQLLPELQGQVLLYGYDRPEVLPTNPNCSLEYDRPTQLCDVLLLWTLPPSWTHLRWLMSRAQPSQIYVRNHCPDLPDADHLKAHLQAQLQNDPNKPLNLLALGQQLWIAPCTLIAALRELGYPCPDFPATCALTQELRRLERWYLYPPQALASIG